MGRFFVLHPLPTDYSVFGLAYLRSLTTSYAPFFFPSLTPFLCFGPPRPQGITIITLTLVYLHDHLYAFTSAAASVITVHDYLPPPCTRLVLLCTITCSAGELPVGLIYCFGAWSAWPSCRDKVDQTDVFYQLGRYLHAGFCPERAARRPTLRIHRLIRIYKSTNKADGQRFLLSIPPWPQVVHISTASPAVTRQAPHKPQRLAEYSKEVISRRTSDDDSRLLSRTPSSAVKRFLWRRQIWFESTFALSMLEPWEKILISESSCSAADAEELALIFVWSLFITGAVRYLPNHISTMSKRASFYITGTSNSTLPIVPIEL
ncbi:hypothetical protein AG1IA_02054 [Rhizoctonia solani AG-1 IA]|uniref:Uncharacterized protein n=1 Tax=Thanatephorus cucumeris (strain AG1-IA) TaxID=983506 RepID=L8X0R9_THACA|nr:hypothetical protein AG1IA_02054 [Rhizoctonia solani AG-1 IA]